MNRPPTAATNKQRQRAILSLTVFVPAAVLLLLGVTQPVILLAAEVGTIALAWFALRYSGRTWATLGLRRPRSWSRAWSAAVGATVAIAFGTAMLLPLLQNLTGQPPDISAFAPLRGNLFALLAGLVVVWSVAAFGEEMLFRGFMLNTLRQLFRADQTPLPWLAALLFSSIAFGAAHTYQGLTGMIGTGMIGLAFGTLYLVSGRNLWIPILTHGLYDTIGFSLVFLGATQV